MSSNPPPVPTSPSPTPTLQGDAPQLPAKMPSAPVDIGKSVDLSDAAERPKSSATDTGGAEFPASEPGFPQVHIVDWDGPDDPTNPKNWSFRKKWAATAVVSAFSFISPVASAMISPASDQLAAEFAITNDVVLALATSVFVLAYAFGPLLLGPLSEIYGRAKVVQISNVWFFAFNTGCGFAQSTGQLVAFRFLAGLGGSAALSIGGGVLGDCWRPEERGQAIAVYSLAPLLGPVIGPICGAWVAQLSTWRWIFWSLSIVDAFIQCLGLLFMRETFAPILLEQKAERVRRSMDLEKGRSVKVVTVFDSADRHWKHIFAKSLLRPFQLFFREPIIQLFGVYMAFVYGTLYLYLTTIGGIFEGIYHEDVGISGLNYIALGIGLSGVSQINARMIDKIYKYLCDRNGGVGRPEFRLPPMIPGTILLPIGLFITGWTAEAHTHWIGPDIGIVVVGAGMILNFQCIQTYVIDTFTLYAASALAAVTFLRSCAGFGFPLFAPAMFNALGYGKGDTVLAVIAIAIGCPAPYLFWKYGERIRAASRYARK
ncbi:uncharacterized protein FIBRA_05040 [Fibroporia radiculosa]|uniref:Major facilitator superfamily (MFS) profile domain-containing protein n=1 Tax=Fibroporia radiculosa TaxID=599839 RepID=J4IAH6_9APHY|nr:uncharacterized protein FIBRA_05040 [Fibroporia radiculosa]CCM02926.1 predicted protein [Fibroporia radiculosa]